MKYCLYYQAHVKREYCWLLVGLLKSFEHMAFDRTIDKEKSIFEFFVPPLMKHYFEDFMEYLTKEGIISSLSEMPNRLVSENKNLKV